MNKEPIRILHCVNKMDRAGLETMLMNYYRNIDKSKIQFDFLTHRSEKGTYDDEIVSMGGRIYYAPRLMPYNFFKYRKFMKDLFKNHPEYKIIHSHIDTMSYFPLREAKRNNIPVRISHSHTSKLDKDLKFPIKYYAKLMLKKVITHKFACGKEAAKFLYGNIDDVTIINNAIDLDKFEFNENDREVLRNEYNIPMNAKVIGHVGRYIYIKNQKYLINLLSEIRKEDENFYLVLIGDGEDKEALIELSKKLDLEKYVLFINSRNDVNRFYNMFDYFIMPSLFEGLPLVGIEAQVNGLICLFSNRISKEIILSSNSYLFDINDSTFYDVKKYISENNFKNNGLNVFDLFAKYDIKKQVLKLEDVYANFNE